jgi:hypothetical protein
MAGVGQQHQLPPPVASAGYRFGQETFAGPRGNEQDAPKPVIIPATAIGALESSFSGRSRLRLFMGAWTMTPALSGPPRDPPLSNNNPFFHGAPLNDKSPEHWFGLFGEEDKVWRGKYKDPEGRFEFSGTMTTG